MDGGIKLTGLTSTKRFELMLAVGTNVGRAHRVKYWSYRFIISISGAEGPGLSIPPTLGPIGPITDPVGPANVCPPYY